MPSVSALPGVPQDDGAGFVVKDGARHAAGIVFVGPGGDCLLLLRSASEENYAGHWSLPGGKADGDETPEAAADREAREELGTPPAGAKKLLDRRGTPTGMVFSTYAQPVDETFSPTLNGEHAGYAWVRLDRLPQPLHPAVKRVLGEHIGVKPDMSEDGWTAAREGFAKWAREKGAANAKGASDSAHPTDSVGRVHLDRIPISKATVNPYKGSEIPGWQELGLEPERIYNLLRDPEELAKAAPSFNGIQLLIKHVPVSAEDHRPDDIVGATGTKAVFADPYLYNDISVWTQPAIDGIEDESQRELSSSYAYTPDMTSGTYQGQKYDGVMRDIKGNHVALVIKGRAGPDVAIDEALEAEVSGEFALDEVKHDPKNGQFSSGGSSGGGEKKKVSVADLKTKLEGMSHAKLTAALNNKDVDPAIKKHIEKELDSRADRGTSKGFGEARDESPSFLENKMTKKTAVAVHSRTAVRLLAGLSVLAMDAKLDFAPALKGVTAKNLKARKPALVKAIMAMDGIEEALAPAAAASGGATPDDVILRVLDMVENQTAAEPPEADEAPAAASTEPNAGPPAAAGGAPDKAKLMEWLKAKGMSDDDMSELDGMMGSAEDEDETDEEKAERLKKEAADKAKDEEKPMVTKEAMDQAIAASVKTAEQRVLKTQREIATAAAYVRPWVGELAMDEAISGGADVYRKALVSLKVVGASDMHPDALKSVLDAQPKPGERRARAEPATLASDEAAGSSYAKRFPAATKIGLQ